MHEPKNIIVTLADGAKHIQDGINRLKLVDPSQEIEIAIAKLEMSVALFTQVANEIQRYLPRQNGKNIDKRTVATQTKIIDVLKTAPADGLKESEIASTICKNSGVVRYQVAKLLILGIVKRTSDRKIILNHDSPEYLDKLSNEHCIALQLCTSKASSVPETKQIDLSIYKSKLASIFNEMSPLHPLSQRDLEKNVLSLNGDPKLIIPQLLEQSVLNKFGFKYFPSDLFAKEYSLERQLASAKAWYRLTDYKKNILDTITTRACETSGQPIKVKQISEIYAISRQAAHKILSSLSQIGFLEATLYGYIPTQITLDYIRPRSNLNIDDIKRD